MKKFIFFLLLLFGFIILFEKNSLYTIFMYLSIILPIIGILFLNYMKTPKKEKNGFCNDLKYFLNIIINIQIMLFIIYFIICFINNYSGADDFKNLYINVVYYMSVISLYIFLNYYSTKSVGLRKNIKFFLNLLINFLKENFILNLFLFIFIVLFRNSKDLLLGILGSYIFFLLTEINENYKKKEKFQYNILYLKLQIMINIVLMLYIINIEIIILAIVNNKELVLDFWFVFRIVILIIITIFNYFGKTIEKIFHIENIEKYNKYYFK